MMVPGRDYLRKYIMNTQTQPTPETDSVWTDKHRQSGAMLTLARKLERERDAARREVAELLAMLERAMPAIRSYAGMVRRSSGHHSERSALADKFTHEVRTLLARVRS